MPNAQKKHVHMRSYKVGINMYTECKAPTNTQKNVHISDQCGLHFWCISGSCQTGVPNRGTKEHVQNLVYLMHFLQARN